MAENEIDTSPKVAKAAAAKQAKKPAAASKQAAAASSAGTAKGKGTVDHVTFHYFAGLGRADPITQMFEYHGQPYTKETETMEGWAQKKADGQGGEFGCGLPQAVFTEGGKERRLAQTGAIMRSFGIRFGYYNTSDAESVKFIDPVIDTWSDIMDAIGAIAFAPADK